MNLLGLKLKSTSYLRDSRLDSPTHVTWRLDHREPQDVPKILPDGWVSFISDRIVVVAVANMSNIPPYPRKNTQPIVARMNIVTSLGTSERRRPVIRDTALRTN